MADPVIVPRAEHRLSRQDIDPDALKVLYRLHQFNHTAYLVGGSVRDLLLGRRPKDFDIGTTAHPHQIKKLFRNCWIIGRRFRLAHVRFGPKTIEVATFRRHVPPGTENEPAEALGTGRPRILTATGDRIDTDTRHENTFGTAEEDAFRRDFTINALFYDIATFSIIDYVGGLEDLARRVVRSIGEPVERFRDDPVRMLRAVVMAARLDFALDPPIVEAIRRERHLMATASPARLIEEYYKVLRSGAAEHTFRMLAEYRLLEPVTPELQKGASREALWRSLRDLDAHRLQHEAAPPTLTNPILLGSLIVPLNLMPSRRFLEPDGDEDGDGDDQAVVDRLQDARGMRRRRAPKEPPLRIGLLPIARRDTERLRQLLAFQRRLTQVEASSRTKRALAHRGPFQEALAWLEIHGRSPDVLEHWRGFLDGIGRPPAESAEQAEGIGQRPRRRRRRRRGGRRGFKSDRPQEG